MSSSFHIPFPRNFLTVNTPVKKSGTVDAAPAQPEQFDHGFLSNRPAVPRHASISSTASSVSETASVSAPSSPPAPAVIAAPVISPLALNAKHTVVPLASLADMTPVARSAFLSNRY